MVTATSQADSTKSATATVTVTPPITVTVSPATATIVPGQTQQFTATLTGTDDQTVEWSATCGTVTFSGLYTAPRSSGTCVVTATSRVDPTKSASATITVMPCSDSFVWLKFYAPQEGTASAKAIVVTPAGEIVAGVDSAPAGTASPVASLVYYGPDGAEHGVIANNTPSSIAAMTYDAVNDIVLATGYSGDDTNPSGHAALLLIGSPHQPQLLLTRSIQLEGLRTEARAISVQGNKIYLAVESEYQHCNPALNYCGGDWIVVTDLQGNVLSKFGVGESVLNTFGGGHTRITGLLLLSASLLVTGDRCTFCDPFSSTPFGTIGQYFEEWWLEGQLKHQWTEELVGAVPIVDPLGNIYVAGTLELPAGLFRTQTFWMSVEKGTLDSSYFAYKRYTLGYQCQGCFDIAKYARANPSGGLTIVGLFSTLWLYPQSDAGAFSLDADLNVLWTRRFDDVPVGTVSAWNAMAYDAEGKAVLAGSGTDGRTNCAQTPCAVAVIGKFCIPVAAQTGTASTPSAPATRAAMRTF
jgi:hypothetical protein